MGCKRNFRWPSLDRVVCHTLKIFLWPSFRYSFLFLKTNYFEFWFFNIIKSFEYLLIATFHEFFSSKRLVDRQQKENCQEFGDSLFEKKVVKPLKYGSLKTAWSINLQAFYNINLYIWETELIYRRNSTIKELLKWMDSAIGQRIIRGFYSL